jgi:hypothetical protein
MSASWSCLWFCRRRGRWRRRLLGGSDECVNLAASAQKDHLTRRGIAERWIGRGEPPLCLVGTQKPRHTLKPFLGPDGERFSRSSQEPVLHDCAAGGEVGGVGRGIQWVG